MILMQNELEELSNDLQEVQGGVTQLRQDNESDLGRLWAFVLATIFALLLVVLTPLFNHRLGQDRSPLQTNVSGHHNEDPSRHV